ncbi:hypothetical protein [Oerskovia merdavium]|uniref:Uncharacterized protein n=1 Tax=Oerskovia merdavium TaxID=2762227 RepID=A0ABR8U3R4_9CELL|nr:hypothetical protein [Oerskovia merdavium]MBD7982154.1 hypothetical protein [Oerskovia merdavium]
MSASVVVVAPWRGGLSRVVTLLAEQDARPVGGEWMAADGGLDEQLRLVGNGVR